MYFDLYLYSAYTAHYVYIIYLLNFLVLTHCQIFNVPAIMYVGVTETDAVDSRAAGMFDALLDQDPLKEVSKVCGRIYESIYES